MKSLPTLATIRPRVALMTILAGTTACAPGPTQVAGTAGVAPISPASMQSTASAPVLLSCPAGQQALMRQVVVGTAIVPQVECVSTAPVAMPVGAPAAVAAPMVASPLVPTYAASPVASYQPVAAAPVRTAAASRPQARRAVYGDDDIVEYRRPAKRSWQKSALIIGSAAGAGAGVGAATGGKKGALIGAAIGGGAATVWDQVTRRQPR